nr:WbqC family protein [Pseudoxanthomonas broegbernensis]
MAAMQPYFFPYLGYFQLAAGADHFVFLDDVAFIRRGFIHRNTILLGGQPFRFTLPVAKASQNRAISEHRFAGDAFARFLQQLRHAYRRAPHFDEAYALVESVCRPGEGVARLCADSVQAVFAHLGRGLRASFASERPSRVGGQARILELCGELHADVYHNPPGGRALYDAAAFGAHGVRLRFVHGRFPAYPQTAREDFMPGLSMIDLLMHNPPHEVARMLDLAHVEDAA